MEVNETPEKILVHEVSARELDIPMKAYHVEYTRTDAFIEKAIVWISNNCYIPHSTLENFKNYMKGE